MSSINEFSPKYLRVQPARNDDDAIIVSVSVELLTEDVNLEQFGHELFALVEQFGCRRIVVSLQEVRVVTSAGLGKMITMHRKMHRHDGHVVFCHVQKEVEDVLRTSRLNTYLTIALDVDAALAVLAALPDNPPKMGAS